MEDEKSVYFLAEIKTLLMNFLCGDENSGNILLQMSGSQELGLKDEEELVIVLNVMSSIIGCDDIQLDNKSKICEIAIGIIANMLLVDDLRQSVIVELILPDSIVSCYSKYADPYLYAESFRLLSILVFYKRIDEFDSNISLKIIGDIDFITNSSTNGKLHTYVFQFLLYIVLYSDNNHTLLTNFKEMWDRLRFIEDILNEYSIFKWVQTEIIGDQTGLEILFSLLSELTDHNSSYHIEDNNLKSSLLVVLLEFLIDHSHHYDHSYHIDNNESLQKSFNENNTFYNYDETINDKIRSLELRLSISEKFIILSIVYNILEPLLIKNNNKNDIDDDGVMSSCYRIIYSFYHFILKSNGLKVLIELLEESIVMRDTSTMITISKILTIVVNKDVHFFILNLRSDNNKNMSSNNNNNNSTSNSSHYRNNQCINAGNTNNSGSDDKNDKKEINNNTSINNNCDGNINNDNITYEKVNLYDFIINDWNGWILSIQQLINLLENHDCSNWIINVSEDFQSIHVFNLIINIKDLLASLVKRSGEVSIATELQKKIKTYCDSIGLCDLSCNTK